MQGLQFYPTQRSSDLHLLRGALAVEDERPREQLQARRRGDARRVVGGGRLQPVDQRPVLLALVGEALAAGVRSEEQTSELQSLAYIVFRLPLVKRLYL